MSFRPFRVILSLFSNVKKKKNALAVDNAPSLYAFQNVIQVAIELSDRFKFGSSSGVHVLNLRKNLRLTKCGTQRGNKKCILYSSPIYMMSICVFYTYVVNLSRTWLKQSRVKTIS